MVLSSLIIGSIFTRLGNLKNPGPQAWTATPSVPLMIDEYGRQGRFWNFGCSRLDATIAAILALVE
jgi:hypothetical protein